MEEEENKINVSISSSYSYSENRDSTKFKIKKKYILFSSPPHPDRLWGPPSLLSNGYRGILPRW
jgi:hypothetical protein